ncbi:hypothetical protein HanRHA438_Chr11g0497411 [Helianthus annuus]|nr:hypothetical protein HanRHA438_Chr11g0497411 [Helianthus annuus]
MHRRLALQTVCFLEDISLKNVFKPLCVLFPTQTWSNVFPPLLTSPNSLSTPLLLISKHTPLPHLNAIGHHLLLYSHRQHLP